ncbi:CYP63 cytochrome P450 monooxygenase-like protein [Collybia nuda]|uniref:CYP63 cytochrome P450 monooxygenase-like protein n=1 Tax=Collybia nuda TaxID=64659 RepID=A0A9P5Y149_9AGAR|nr:CYP63 cytochrome P450 monooxygenase-like protein [Collybia nuda]
MAVFTPGIDFIIRHLVNFSLPPILLAATVRYLASTYDHAVPTWLLVSGSILSVPLASAARIIKKSFTDRRDAAAMGARLAPLIEGKSIGNLDILAIMTHAWDFGYPADGMMDFFEKLGPVANMRILWSDLIFTTSPEHIKLILATDFQNYVKGERFHKTMFSVLGSGVFNSDGDMWKFHRSMSRPFFTRDRISDFDLFDRHADTVIKQIKTRMRTGYPVDFQDLMGRFTLDSASEFLFGHCMHALSAGLPYPHNAGFIPPEYKSAGSDRANEFARAFLAAQEIISSRERNGWIWPLMEIKEDKTKEPMKIVNAYLAPIIKEAIAKKEAAPKREESEKGEKVVEDGETLIDHLVNLSSDPIVLRDETMNIMIGTSGRDTTAAALTFVIYFLSMYPEVNVRLRQEILEKVGPTRRPDYDDIREMKYLRAVINETLRLFPIVPFNTRENIHATTWPSPDPTQKPIYIPAGTKVPYSVFMMHRRKDLWGPDAEEFDPDRFLDERLKKYLMKNSFIFLPFNAGPRICLGQQFAYNEMSFMLVRLLQNFSSVALDVEACPPEMRPPAEWAAGPGRKAIEKLWPKVHLTMHTYGGLWVKMQEADNSV